MPISTLTVKGQTTIPKEIRDSLHLKPKDKLLYVVSGDAVILRPLHGSLRGLKGLFKHVVRRPVEFHKLREETKRIVGKRVAEGIR